MGFYSAAVRLENLDEGAACFEKESGVTHVMDDGAAFVLQQVIAQPGIDRDTLLANLMASFDDDPSELAVLLDNILTLLLKKGLLRDTETLCVHW